MMNTRKGWGGLATVVVWCPAICLVACGGPQAFRERAALQQEVDTARAENERLRHEREEAHRRLHELELEVSRQAEVLTVWREQLARYEREHARLGEENESLTAERNKLRATLAELRQALAMTEARAQEYRQVVRRLESIIGAVD